MEEEAKEERQVESTIDEEELSAGDVFDKLLNYVDGNGVWQIRMFLFTSFCGLFVAMQNLSAALLAASPDHRCVIPELERLNISLDIPGVTRPSEGSEAKCSYYKRDYEDLFESGVLGLNSTAGNLTLAPLEKCSKWNYDHSLYSSTVVEEWNLVCSNKWLMSTCQSTFMAGVLIGALLLSEFSDKFGRRTIVLISAVGFFTSSVFTTFSPNFIVFIVLRFFTAAFGSGLFLPNFVLLMEVVGLKYRTTMGILYQAFFSVGFMMLPVIGYFIRDWRSLQLAISVPSVLLLVYYWLPESPRWLMMEGRFEEALKILEDIARVNKKCLPSKEETNVLIEKMKEQRTEENKSVFQKVIQFFSSQVTLMRTRNMRRRCSIIFFVWMVVSMIYYGLTFSGANIDASVYLMLFLGGAVEIPSYVLGAWTLKLFGRRLNLSVMFVICGSACLLILFIPKELIWVNIALANTGKFFNSAAFSVAYIYSAELVPTPVRNIAVGTSSMWARIGSMMAPYIVDLLGDVHYAVPSTVFGVLSIAAGCLALLLPETGKIKLPETIEEVEALPR